MDKFNIVPSAVISSLVLRKIHRIPALKYLKLFEFF